MNNFILKHLLLSGPSRSSSELVFEPGLNFFYGASNTGKSFALECINFMLGGSNPVEQINELRGYDRIELALKTPNGNDVILHRAVSGGAFEVIYDGRTFPLSATHSNDKDSSLSGFFLDQLDLLGRQIAKNVHGEKKPLSFRDLVHLALADETSIQSKRSPIETGVARTVTTIEKNVFKFLLTGLDDSAIISRPKPKEFHASRKGKIELLEQMLAEIVEELPNAQSEEELQKQFDRLDDQIKNGGVALGNIRQAISSNVEEKQRVVRENEQRSKRYAEIEVNLSRFNQLNSIYFSDIDRLQSIEEAGFLLLLQSDKDCPLCGANVEAQKHSHGKSEIQSAKSAAEIEIKKIAHQQTQLKQTVDQLELEKTSLAQEIDKHSKSIELLENLLKRDMATLNEYQKSLNELLPTRDKIKHQLDLIQRHQSLQATKIELEKMRQKSDPKPDLDQSTNSLHEFSLEVSNVLREWNFPGELIVNFDEKKYDVNIDGKRRSANGKGVRAITHAAFKVALLIYCKNRNLPHPGFIVLDTPLLTYRDPLKSKYGELEEDEKAFSSSSLKENFFKHLQSLSVHAQFIVFENVDPPMDLHKVANVQIFSGVGGGGRKGLIT